MPGEARKALRAVLKIKLWDALEMRPYRRLDLGICRLATLSLLILVPLRRIFLALFQESQNFPQQHFVFQIYLII